MTTLYRVKIVRDTDARFEECNGEARPLTEDEYRENSYRACPLHRRAGTQVLQVGPPQIQGCAACGNTAYEDIPYAEYRAYYGNPRLHVYLGVIVESMTPPVGDWIVADSLWGIDSMREDVEAKRQHRNRWLSPTEALALPGYLADCCAQVLEEAGYTK